MWRGPNVKQAENNKKQQTALPLLITLRAGCEVINCVGLITFGLAFCYWKEVESPSGKWAISLWNKQNILRFASRHETKISSRQLINILNRWWKRVRVQKNGKTRYWSCRLSLQHIDLCWVRVHQVARFQVVSIKQLPPTPPLMKWMETVSFWMKESNIPALTGGFRAFLKMDNGSGGLNGASPDHFSEA